jgi:hypothetical protein
MDHEKPEEQDETEIASEGERAWRERTQKTKELGEKLSPPHDRDAERRSPSPDP